MERTNKSGCAPGASSSIEDQVRLRERKAAALWDRRVRPYGSGIVVRRTTGLVRKPNDGQDAAALEAAPSEPSLFAGWVMALRPTGKVTFDANNGGRGAP